MLMRNPFGLIVKKLLVQNKFLFFPYSGSLLYRFAVCFGDNLSRFDYRTLGFNHSKYDSVDFGGCSLDF